MNRRHQPTVQRLIGLTGGIGMGKTTVSDYLAQVHHLPVLDADILAREAVEPGTSVLSTIVDRYGSGILLPDGVLDRQRLGNIIFNSVPERLWLEQQIHPYVRERLEQSIYTPPLNNARQHPIVVLVIPLLFEARMTDLVTETWVIQCPEDCQMERLMHRDQLDLQQAQARINNQMPIQKKVARADVVLDNSSTLENLYQQIDRGLVSQVKQISIPKKF